MFPMVRRLSSTPREAFGPLSWCEWAGGGDGLLMGCSWLRLPVGGLMMGRKVDSDFLGERKVSF